MSNKQQIVVVVAVLLGFGLVIGVAARMSSGGDSPIREHRFFGKAGKTRERATPLVTKREAYTPKGTSSDKGTREDGESDDLALRARRLRSDTRPEATPEEKVIQAATVASSPEEGIEELRGYLATVASTAEVSQIYTALGRFHAQTDPPQLEAAEQAFATAEAAAHSPSERHAARQAHAEVLLRFDERERAQEVIRAGLESPDVTLPGMQLRIMLGKIHEAAGRLQDAETCYKDCAQLALDAVESLGAPALDVYRAACLHLARLYRESGRSAEVEAVSRDMRTNLALYSD